MKVAASKTSDPSAVAVVMDPENFRAKALAAGKAHRAKASLPVVDCAQTGHDNPNVQHLLLQLDSVVQENIIPQIRLEDTIQEKDKLQAQLDRALQEKIKLQAQHVDTLKQKVQLICSLQDPRMLRLPCATHWKQRKKNKLVRCTTFGDPRRTGPTKESRFMPSRSSRRYYAYCQLFK